MCITSTAASPSIACPRSCAITGTGRKQPYDHPAKPAQHSPQSLGRRLSASGLFRSRQGALMFLVANGCFAPFLTLTTLGLQAMRHAGQTPNAPYVPHLTSPLVEHAAKVPK